MRTFIAFALLLLGGMPVFSQSPQRLFIRPWIELEPLVRIDAATYPLPVAEAEKSLLDDARRLFSGMVYGWTFSYIPGDKARHVEESFVLTPVALIARGTPRLQVVDTEASGARLWARISYSLPDAEARRRSAWDSNTAALSTGTGKADAIKGPAAREESLADAIRDAIRLSLDSRYLNKPRQITGEVILWDDPQVVVSSGAYLTTAKVKLLVRELVPYRIF